MRGGGTALHFFGGQKTIKERFPPQWSGKLRNRRPSQAEDTVTTSKRHVGQRRE